MCGKMANNYNLVKGLSMRQKLQKQGYAKSPDFLQVLGLFIFKKKSVTTIEVN